MKLQDQIQVETDERGHRYHIIYSKDGTRHEIGQLLDAEEAIRSGAYFATKPTIEKKARKKL